MDILKKIDIIADSEADWGNYDAPVIGYGPDNYGDCYTIERGPHLLTIITAAAGEYAATAYTCGDVVGLYTGRGAELDNLLADWADWTYDEMEGRRRAAIWAAI